MASVPSSVSRPCRQTRPRSPWRRLVAEYKNIVGGKPITEAELKDEQSNATLGLPGTSRRSSNFPARTAPSSSTTCLRNSTTPTRRKSWRLHQTHANEVAKKYILPSHLIWVVVGDMSKVEAGIRELNIGEVHKIDADGNPIQ